MVGKSHASTRVMGTYGYASPEYIATDHLTARSGHLRGIARMKISRCFRTQFLQLLHQLLMRIVVRTGKFQLLIIRLGIKILSMFLLLRNILELQCLHSLLL